MNDLKVVFASNLIDLRTKAGMTQLELAEKLNYSDKSVSKWERAEAIPDVAVVKEIALIFGVTVDYMLETHDQWQYENKPDVDCEKYNAKLITAISGIGIFTLATLLFVILWIAVKPYPLIYAAALPVFFITLLVLNSVWHIKMSNVSLVMLLILSVFLLLYLIFIDYNIWQMVFVLIPSEIIAFLSFRFKTKKAK